MFFLQSLLLLDVRFRPTFHSHRCNKLLGLVGKNVENFLWNAKIVEKKLTELYEENIQQWVEECEFSLQASNKCISSAINDYFFYYISSLIQQYKIFCPLYKMRAKIQIQQQTNITRQRRSEEIPSALMFE